MEERINNLIHRIFHEHHTEEVCFSLEKEMKELLEDAPIELRNRFTESGAGEMLYMLCSGFRYEKTKEAS